MPPRPEDQARAPHDSQVRRAEAPAPTHPSAGEEDPAPVLAELGRFGLGAATEFCRSVARGGPGLLDRVLDQHEPVERWSAHDWAVHQTRCPYCRRMLRRRWAERAARAAGLGPGEWLPGQAAVEQAVSPRLEALTRRLRPAVSSLAVLYTDMGGSTAYARRYGDTALYERMQVHNGLLGPLVPEHGGTFVRLIGDAILAFFDEPAQAARCAAAVQRRLAEHNAALPAEERLEVRAGIHYGRCVLFHEGGRPDLAGLGVNAGARVVAAAGGAVGLVLLSEQARRRLPPGEFVTRPFAVADARGVGRMELHELDWRAAGGAGAAPREQGEPAAADDSDDPARAVWGLAATAGGLRPVAVHVRVTAAEAGCLRLRTSGGPAGAVEAAAREAFAVLAGLGFEGADPARHAVEWWAEGVPAPLDSASVGLATALAAAASFTGADVDGGLAALGEVLPGGELGRTALPLVLAGDGERPREVLLAAPGLHAWPGEVPRLVGVGSLADAVLEALGPALGLEARLFHSALPASPPGGGRPVALTVEPDTPTRATRDAGVRRVRGERTWAIGDHILLCVTVREPCHVTVVNVGTSGRLWRLLPNAGRPVVRVEEVMRFPGPADEFELPLSGPAGCEVFVAIASRRPLGGLGRLTGEDGRLRLGRLADVERLREELAAEGLGWAEARVYVTDRGRW